MKKLLVLMWVPLLTAMTSPTKWQTVRTKGQVLSIPVDQKGQWIETQSYMLIDPKIKKNIEDILKATTRIEERQILGCHCDERKVEIAK